MPFMPRKENSKGKEKEMTDVNPHTGAKLSTKELTRQGKENWDMIFPPKKKENKDEKKDIVDSSK